MRDARTQLRRPTQVGSGGQASGLPISRLWWVLQKISASPARAVALSFALLIACGTLLLMLPVATSNRTSIGLVDALFTATSAACVTGLIVVDTGSYFSLFGQIVILLLIQFGGLGIMTLSSFVGLALRRRLSLRSGRALRDVLDIGFSQEATSVLRAIVMLTLAFEAAGAVALCFVFMGHEPTPGRAIYSAVFHSVSAFCNAGFSLYPDNLMAFRESVWTNLVLAGLIVSGGLGFVVLRDLYRLAWSRLRRERLRATVQVRLIVLITGLLIVLGSVLLGAAEWSGDAMSDMTLRGRILGAFFQSVTARTAGFNTVDIGAFGAPAILLLVWLMIIGASPGSTGGGIKTSTFGIILGAVRTLVSERQEVELFRRRIPAAVVRKAFVVTSAYVSYLMVGLMLLLLTEQATRGGFLDMLFESASAIGTVGLSTGVTPTLSPAGRLIVVALMYGGRIGPLTLVAAMGQRETPPAYQYAEESVMIG